MQWNTWELTAWKTGCSLAQVSKHTSPCPSSSRRQQSWKLSRPIEKAHCSNGVLNWTKLSCTLSINKRRDLRVDPWLSYLKREMVNYQQLLWWPSSLVVMLVTVLHTLLPVWWRGDIDEMLQAPLQSVSLLHLDIWRGYNDYRHHTKSFNFGMLKIFLSLYTNIFQNYQF